MMEGHFIKLRESARGILKLRVEPRPAAKSEDDDALEMRFPKLSSTPSIPCPTLLCTFSRKVRND